MQTNTAFPPPDPTAVLGRRIVAYIIDFLLAMVLAVGLFAAVADHATARNADAAQRACDIITTTSDDACVNLGAEVYVVTSGESGLISLVLLAYGVFFHVLLPGVSGYSPGKAVMGLRIVKKDDGTIAGIGANAVRWLLLIVDWFPFFFPLVGIITAASSKGHRRVGDMAAGTLVVGKEAVGRPPEIPGLTAGAPAPPAWSSPTPPPPSGTWAPPPPAAPSAPNWPPPPATPEPTPPAPPSDTTAPTEAPAPAPFAPPTPPEPAGQATPVPPETSAPDATPPETGTPDATPPETGTADTTPPETTAVPTGAEAASRDEITASEEAEPGAGEAATAGEEASRPGVDAPMWDEARNTYIQWDPQLQQWMEWDEANGRWIPIST